MEKRNDWAIVLAAGDGTRLAALTEHAGTPVPKQYWSIDGERSLLGDTLRRAERLVDRRRIVVVVAERHRAWWRPELAALPAHNVLVQPENRGTAPGLLLPLLAILRRDPRARVLVLPSDHHVLREYVLGVSLRLALEGVARDEEGVVLLGIGPDAPETGYGWIVPRGEGRDLERVEAFVEKPERPLAEALMARGGLWNSFVMAAGAPVLLRLFEEQLPALVAAMAAVAPDDERGLAGLYRSLEPSDASRELLQRSAGALRLLRVPACGWTDLGTPERVAARLAELAARRRPAGAYRRPEPRAARFRFAAALQALLADPVGSVA